MSRTANRKPNTSIQNDQELDNILQQIDRLVMLRPHRGTREDRELTRLSRIVEEYESTHCSLDDDDNFTPQQYVAADLADRFMSEEVLEQWLGGTEGVRSFLDGKRGLTDDEIRLLEKHHHIPADLLREKPEHRETE